MIASKHYPSTQDYNAITVVATSKEVRMVEHTDVNDKVIVRYKTDNPTVIDMIYHYVTGNGDKNWMLRTLFDNALAVIDLNYKEMHLSTAAKR